MWQKLLPEFMHNFTGFEPVKNVVENVRLAQRQYWMSLQLKISQSCWIAMDSSSSMETGKKRLKD
jgi:hypothetical protein